MGKSNWKTISGFNGKYLISDKGEVLEKNELRKMKIRLKPDGYCWTTLKKDGEYKNFYIHRLVAETFIPRTEGRDQVNHKNGIKTDNCVENLEWVNSSENQCHRMYVLKKVDGCYPMKKVFCVETGESFQSVGEAGRSLGISANCIAKVARGNTSNKTAGGFHWKYVTE